MEKATIAPTGKGPADRFTGDVYVDMVVAAPAAGFSVGRVYFTGSSDLRWG